MKSQERIDKERERRKMLWFALAFAFILMVLVLLMMFGTNGVGYAMNEFFHATKENIINAWDKIMFKLENFFTFVKGNK